MINTSKPTTSLSNSAYPSRGETWASITSQWQNETHTWLQISQLISNSSKVSSSIINTAKPV